MILPLGCDMIFWTFCYNCVCVCECVWRARLCVCVFSFAAGSPFDHSWLWLLHIKPIINCFDVVFTFLVPSRPPCSLLLQHLVSQNTLHRNCLITAKETESLTLNHPTSRSFISHFHYTTKPYLRAQSSYAVISSHNDPYLQAHGCLLPVHVVVLSGNTDLKVGLAVM